MNQPLNWTGEQKKRHTLIPPNSKRMKTTNRLKVMERVQMISLSKPFSLHFPSILKTIMKTN